MKFIRKTKFSIQVLLGRHKRNYSVVECDLAMVRAARKLHADAFLRAGFISAVDVNEHGEMHMHVDKYHDIAEYFIALDSTTNEPKAACRLLSSDDKNHLQAIKNTKFSDEENKFLESIDSSVIVELSGLAKKPGESSLAVIALFRSLLELSRLKGVQYWVMVVNEGYYKSLKSSFNEFIIEIGQPTEYMNTKVNPCLIDIQGIFCHKVSWRHPIQKIKYKLNSYVYLR